MTRTVTRAILLAALAALLLTAAACGGDDDESAAATQAPAATAEPSDTTSDTNEESEDTEESEESEGDLPEGFSGSEECRELVGLGAKVTQALSGTGGDLDDTQEFLDAFADDAPEEIREDFQVIAEAYGKIVEALEGVDLSSGEQPDPEALAELQQLSTELDQPRIQEANENITAWVEENCGVQTD
jgi:hypothetical protein